MTVEQRAKQITDAFDREANNDPTMTRSIAEDIARQIVPSGWDYSVHESIFGKFYLTLTGYRGETAS